MRSATLASGDATRWLFSGLVALALHASGVVLLTRWPPVHDGDGEASAIVVDLAPFSAEAPAPSNQDIAPGHLQQQAPQAPETEKTDEKTEEKIDSPPPAPDPEVVLPQETPRIAALLRENVAPPAPIDTAPPTRRASAAQIASWHRRIALQIERHKGYPAAARAHRQTGIAQLGFVIDRAGRVVASRIVRSSGVAALDHETLATVRRAQPFPPPPPEMPGERFDFTVPIRFNIR